ncbi:MAG TPA: hypothetical protein VHP83_06515 [Aggregatilineaceae bacterium]|nr:hypothetical protein [Aggregatilineaceae bacterium]
MKRKMVILTLLVIFALSLTASVVMPGSTTTHAAAKSGVTTLASLRFTEYDLLNPPECPSPIDPGC